MSPWGSFPSDNEIAGQQRNPILKDGSVPHLFASLQSPVASRRIGCRKLWLLAVGVGLLLQGLIGTAGAQPGPKRPPTRPTTPPPATKKPDPRALQNTAEPPPPDYNLPEGYQPPPPPNEMMLLVDELLQPADIENFKKIRTKYSSALRNGSTTAADRQLINEGLRYRVHIMTMADQRRELHDRRSELVQLDLNNAGRIMKPDDVRGFRKSVLDEVVKLTVPLLKNNFYVRIQAATLLGELDWIPDDPTRGLKHESFWPAFDPLVKVLKDPEQPVAVKIAAARSLVRLTRFGEVPVTQRYDIAKAITEELANPQTHYWYQMRLIDVLASLDVTLDLQTRKPFVVNSLLDVVRDAKRDFRTRSNAVWALGRVPLDREVDISAMLRDIMQLTLELGTAAQENKDAPQWRQCFVDLYLAYKPADGNDKDATRKSPAGLLSNSQTATAAGPTYKLTLPMVNAVITGKGVSVAEVQAVQAWLDQNSPAPKAGVVGANAAGTSRAAQPANTP